MRGPALDIVWKRAAALGGLWAASEIVFGSFLHNLHVPMRGQLLTGLAVALLSAAHCRRGGRGLLWRAGLVCAALKSISPSAVLIGPMIAIAMEGLLMEGGLRVLGPRPAGYALAGALAMSWTYLHMLSRTVIVYGIDAARLYEAAWGRVQSGFGVAFGPWQLLALLGAAHAVAGAAAALAGLRLARGARRRVAAQGLRSATQLPDGRSAVAPGSTRLPMPYGSVGPPNEAPRFRPSLAGAVANLLVVVAVLAAARRLPLLITGALTVGVVAAWTFVYPTALRRLRRPGLWLSLAAVGLGAGLLLGRSGAEAGARMVLRALALTAGFAALGQELAGDHIRERARRLGAGRWISAVEAAFASLPALVARLPEPRAFLSRPGAAVAALLDALPSGPSIHVVTGEKDSGKTTLVLAVADALRTRGASVAGIAAPGLWKNGQRQSFDVVDVRDGRRVPLCRRQAPESWTEQTGPYRFSPEGLAFGRRALAAAGDADLVIVDEVGPLELSRGGWSEALDLLASSRNGPMLWVTRAGLLDAIEERWGRPSHQWKPSAPIENILQALAADMATRDP